MYISSYQKLSLSLAVFKDESLKPSFPVLPFPHICQRRNEDDEHVTMVDNSRPGLFGMAPKASVKLEGRTF